MPSSDSESLEELLSLCRQGPATAACAATAARLSGWNCWILAWRNGCCLGLGMLFVLLLFVVVCLLLFVCLLLLLLLFVIVVIVVVVAVMVVVVERTCDSIF